jgi:hypothetical protein
LTGSSLWLYKIKHISKAVRQTRQKILICMEFFPFLKIGGGGIIFLPYPGESGKGGSAGYTGDAGRKAHREWLVLMCAVARKIVKEGENG